MTCWMRVKYHRTGHEVLITSASPFERALVTIMIRHYADVIALGNGPDENSLAVS